MTGVVQFVALDVPHCTLTYSVLPCRAQVGFDVAGGAPTNGSEPNAVGFGSDTYAVRSGGLTGAADSKQALGSFWIFAGAGGPANQTLFAGTTTLGGSTSRFSIRFVSGQLRIVGVATGGATTLDIRTNTTTFNIGSWYHILFSYDLTSTALRHLYIDDVSDLTASTFNNNNIDYTLADWSFGAKPDGSEHMGDSSIYADFWLRFGSYVDLSVAANRRKFISANGNPVYLGTIGQAPGFGTPIVYFGNAGTDFHTNLGTGGGFAAADDGTQYGDDFATGSRKCFNSLGTCQDLENFTEETVTLLFSENVPNQLEATVYPFIKTVDYQPAIVSLEGEIGQRASLKVVFRDAPHSDTPASIFDKYLAGRGYDPYTRGSFWGKFRARNPYMRGRQIRLYIGEAGQDLESLETRYFIIDSTDGPTAEGEFAITAQDILKLTSGDQIVTPSPSSGFLAADIAVGAGTTTISPPGALADPFNQYGTDGFGCFGGNEVVHYSSISGDLVTVDARGQFNTEETTHNAEDRFQHCAGFEPSDPADIIYSLLVDIAGINPAYITIDDWHAESATYLGINIVGLFTEPTAVDKILTEILQATGSALWWDDVNQQVRWQVIRSIPTTADRFTEDNVLLGTLEVTEQPEKRVSQVIVYFGQINPTIKVDEERNYRSTETVNDDLTEFLEGSSAIKKIYARAIAQGGRSVANRIASRYLNRFKRAPRRFKFELLRFSVAAPSLGGGYLLGGSTLVLLNSWPFQDDTGAPAEIPIQVTRVSSAPDRWIVEAEEMLASAQEDQIDTTVRNIFIDSNQNNVNLKTIHDSLFREAVDGDTVNCIINGGIIIGSDSTANPALDIGGGWNSGVTITVTNNGRVQGAGGNGGNANVSSSSTASVGAPGGPALFTRQAFTLTNNAQIWGGGGGGGAGFFQAINGSAQGGGGGSGTNAGNGGTGTGASFPKGNNPGQNGSDSAGGLGGNSTDSFLHGGNGGGPGLAGSSSVNTSQTGNQRAGGAAGAAIDGVSFITSVAAGDVQGPQIN